MASFVRMHVSRFGKFIAGVSLSGSIVSYGFSTVFAKETRSDNSFMTDPVTTLDQLQSSPGDMRTKMELMIMHMQRKICDELSCIENTPFVVDRWEREGGGGGITCVIQDGKNYTLCVELF